MTEEGRRDAVDSEATCPQPPKKAPMVAHLFSFSIGLDEIPKRRVCRASVLAVLARAKRFSEFEVTSTVAPVLDALIKDAAIAVDNSIGYPWSKVELTALGRKELEESDHAE